MSRAAVKKYKTTSAPTTTAASTRVLLSHLAKVDIEPLVRRRVAAFLGAIPRWHLIPKRGHVRTFQNSDDRRFFRFEVSFHSVLTARSLARSGCRRWPEFRRAILRSARYRDLKRSARCRRLDFDSKTSSQC